MSNKSCLYEYRVMHTNEYESFQYYIQYRHIGFWGKIIGWSNFVHNTNSWTKHIRTFDTVDEALKLIERMIIADNKSKKKIVHKQVWPEDSNLINHYKR